MPFAGGKHCEVWVGLWKKGNKEGNSREGVDDEKVSMGPAISILLTCFFAGGLENAQGYQLTGQGI